MTRTTTPKHCCASVKAKLALFSILACTTLIVHTIPLTISTARNKRNSTKLLRKGNLRLLHLETSARLCNIWVTPHCLRLEWLSPHLAPSFICQQRPLLLRNFVKGLRVLLRQAGESCRTYKFANSALAFFTFSITKSDGCLITHLFSILPIANCQTLRWCEVEVKRNRR